MSGYSENIVGYVYGRSSDMFSKTVYETGHEAIEAGLALGWTSFFIGILVEDNESIHDTDLLPSRFRSEIISMTDKVLSESGVSVKGYKVMSVTKFDGSAREASNIDFL